MQLKEGYSQFLMPIGDWSGDGHGKCKYFLVHSNKPVDEVLKVNKRIKESTGINLDTICDEEYNRTIWDYEKDELELAGFDTSKLKVYEYDDEKYEMNSEIMIDLWIFLLMKTDPTIELKIVPIDILKSEFVGYGLV